MSPVRAAPLCLLLTACFAGKQPTPAPPPRVVPSAPVDSRSNGWGSKANAVEVVIDTDTPAKIEASRVDPVVMCATTPCLTRFPPGAYTLIASVDSPESRRCSVLVQISAVPTIVRLSLPAEGWGDCGVTLWAPEDQAIYTGSIR